MNTDPIPNDPNDPLVSILVFNYDGQYLQTMPGQHFPSGYSEKL